jgi:predicted 3-demethylubiquinone-9 3-methyltransferase (glyoxalase superfamily)
VKKIRPFIWFDDQAEEAAKFYTSIFKNSKILNVNERFATFELEGQEIMALNGGPHFQLTPAFSFFVDCKTQQEVDDLWERLSAGGKKSQCGWLTDKFGLSWQIIPSALGELMGDDDEKKSSAVMKAMLEMEKIDIKGLQEAYDNA